MGDSHDPDQTLFHPASDDVESWELPENSDASLRYTLGEEIARGGMGIVYAARDEQFHREVAVKVLHDELVSRSIPRRRFVEESRISGQLQHPGIPPVFDLGTLPDGRLFLAMKLIHGETLAELLERDKPELSVLVQIFEQIAQTVAYAHSKRVVHRDLKPHNVMVGAFTEVQVMDWGLAKVLGDTGLSVADLLEVPTSDSSLDTDRGDSSTQAGSVLGTPAYMPPEQATGQVDQVDTRADVFALGAILCELLTGQPPYIGSSTQIVASAIGAHLSPAIQRLEACSADRELIQIAIHCLQADPEQRPKDASIVAQSIADYQTGIEERLRQVEVDTATSQAKADELWKRRTLQVSLAVLVLCLLVVAGVLVWTTQRAESRREFAFLYRNRERETRNLSVIADVKQALGEAMIYRQRGLAQTDRPQAWLSSLENAKLQIGQANKLLATTIRLETKINDDIQNDIQQLAQVIEGDRKICNLFIEFNQLHDENDERMLMPVALTDRQSEKYEIAFRNAGCDLHAMTTEEVVAWLNARPGYRTRLVAGLMNWSRVAPFVPSAREAIPMQVRLKHCLQAAIDDPFLLRWREAIQTGQFASMIPLLETKEILERDPYELQALIDMLNRLSVEPENQNVPLNFLRRVREHYPSEYWINLLTGWNLTSVKAPSDQEYEEGLRYLTVAAALRPKSAIPLIALTTSIRNFDTNYNDPQALHNLTKAVEVEPNSAIAHAFLAMLRERRGEHQLAQEQIFQTINIDPIAGYFWMKMVFFTLPRIPDQVNHPQAMTADQWNDFLQAAIDLHPEQPGGYINRAEYRLSQGLLSAAHADYRKALDRADESLFSNQAIITAHLRQLDHELMLRERYRQYKQDGDISNWTPDERMQVGTHAAAFAHDYRIALELCEPVLLKYPEQYRDKIRTAGWMIQASLADDSTLEMEQRQALRRLALARIKAYLKSPDGKAILLARRSEFDPVTKPELRAQLPAEEQAAWAELFPAPRSIDQIPSIK